MRQKELFYWSAKEAPKDEVSLNAQLLIRAGFADKLMAGVYSILPLGLRVMKKIEQIIREEMTAIGGQEVFLPTLQPKENWQTTGRWDEVDVLYKLESGDGKELALGPTHEEVIVPLAKKYVSSYKNLPFALFQFQNKFRNEKRAKSGLMRGREFMMKDLYSYHSTETDLDAYYEKAKEAYVRVFERCGLGEKTYVTYASGGTFSKYSHEFQTLTEAGEDIIHICDGCHIAINKEIIEDQNYQCPVCGNKDLRQAKAVEVGNIFKLMTKFSEPFELMFTDSDGSKKPVIMGCYGIGLQRLMGTIVELYNDDRGIVWPRSVAPFAVHLVAIGNEDSDVYREAERIYKDLLAHKIEVIFDDRTDVGAGKKFAESDLMGIPYRLVVSEKTLAEGKIECKMRNSQEVRMVDLSEVYSLIK